MTGRPRNPAARRRGHVTSDRWTPEEWEAVRRLSPWQRRGAVLDLARAAERDREADEPTRNP